MRHRFLFLVSLLLLVGCTPAPKPDHFEPISYERPPVPAAIAEWAEDHIKRPGVWLRTVEGQTYVVASWGEKDHPGTYNVTITALERMADDTLVVEIELTHQTAAEAPAQPPTDFVAFSGWKPKGFLVRFAETDS